MSRLLSVFLLSLLTMPVAIRAEDKGAARPLLIDVRTEAEWQVEHLQGAILIPYDKIGDEIGKVAPDKNTKIELYCRTGRRSGVALESLKKLGYGDVTNYGSVSEAAEKLKVPIIKG
ncbi:MAG: rhodanese-like domain-containing protein, partial [Geobacter sp.]|nr:rhodanese-like domain-containing protein [Geobacter sp.]